MCLSDEILKKVEGKLGREKLMGILAKIEPDFLEDNQRCEVISLESDGTPVNKLIVVYNVWFGSRFAGKYEKVVTLNKEEGVELEARHRWLPKTTKTES